MQAVYDLAILINPWVQCFIGVAIIAGLIADHGGTRRIGLVVAAVTLFFTFAPLIPGWLGERFLWLAIGNAAAAAPLLVHPITSRQQGIAATFLGLGVIHCVFYVLSVTDPMAVTANWLVSRLVDVVQAGLLLWWSWPNARERLSGLYHKGASGMFHSRLPSVSGTPSVRAPD